MLFPPSMSLFSHGTLDSVRPDNVSPGAVSSIRAGQIRIAATHNEGEAWGFAGEAWYLINTRGPHVILIR